MAKESKSKARSFRYVDLIERWGVERGAIKAAAEKGKIQRLPSTGAVSFSEESVQAFEKELGWETGQKFPFPRGTSIAYFIDSLGNRFRVRRDEATGHVVAEPPFTPQAAEEFADFQHFGTLMFGSIYAKSLYSDESLSDGLRALAKEVKQEMLQKARARRSSSSADLKPSEG